MYMQLFMKLPAELCIAPVHYIFEWVGSWYGGILVLNKELFNNTAKTCLLLKNILQNTQTIYIMRIDLFPE
jgi:hypothetical protein